MSVDDKIDSNLWIEEVHQGFLGMRFKVEKVLFSGKSDFQTVQVVETTGHGKMLFNDGMVMVSERDEFVYHDMIVHPVMYTHPNPRSVLVIGGGDGGTVREVLRHKSVEKVVMVEIDKMVVDACMEHIPLTSSQLKDPKVELRYEDGVKYMAESKEQFDVIIVDSSDPIGPATPLFNESFYADVYSRLADDGIVVSQCESPVYEGAMQKTILKILSDKFNVVRLANYSNLTYPGSLWSFSMGSKKNDPLKDFQSERYDSDGLEFKYYNSKIHTGAFMLPEFQYKELKEFLTP